MSYLRRLRAKIEAADPRPAVKQQLHDEDEEPIAPPPKKRKKPEKPRFSLKDEEKPKRQAKPAEPGKFSLDDLGDDDESDKKTPKTNTAVPDPSEPLKRNDEQEDAPAPKTQKSAPPKEEREEDEDEDEDEQPKQAPKGKGLPTGQSLTDKDGRYGEIKKFKPWLFIVSGAGGQAGALLAYLKSVESVINNPDVVERIAGPDTVDGKSNNPLDLTFAWFVAERVSQELVHKAFKGLQAQAVDFRDRLGQARPFDAIKLNAESVLKGEARNFRAEMQEHYMALRDKDEAESIGAVSALQMASVIPLDYLRWFDRENKKHEFYMGGYPDNAGRVGLIYVLCTEEESKTFLRAVKEFKPLPNFVDDMHFISNIDSGFKTIKPRDVMPDNCIILVSKTKFDPAAKISGGKSVLEALTTEAKGFANGGEDAGQYVKGTHVQGNLVAHFSADMKRCALWVGRKPVTVDQKAEERLMATFGLESIDTTFSK